MLTLFYEGGIDSIFSFVPSSEEYIKIWWTGTGRYLWFCSCEEMCNISLFCCSQIPLSHQFPLYYPMFSGVGILSNHQILNFVFPQIWPFTDQALFLSDCVYISDPESTFFVLSRPGVLWFWFIIFTTVSSLRAPGRDAGIARIYGRDCWRKMYALFWFPFFPTPGSYFPNSGFCHFKHYLPFAEMHQFIWWRCVK